MQKIVDRAKNKEFLKLTVYPQTLIYKLTNNKTGFRLWATAEAARAQITTIMANQSDFYQSRRSKIVKWCAITKNWNINKTATQFYTLLYTCDHTVPLHLTK